MKDLRNSIHTLTGCKRTKSNFRNLLTRISSRLRKSMIQNFSKRSNRQLNYRVKDPLGIKPAHGKSTRESNMFCREDKKLKIDVLKQYF